MLSAVLAYEKMFISATIIFINVLQPILSLIEYVA